MCNTSTGCVLGGSGLGSGRQEGSPAGETAANEILKPFLAGACVDEHTQDQVSAASLKRYLNFFKLIKLMRYLLQMIILMALAKGTSQIKVGDKKLTCHTETAMQVAEIMLGKRGLRFNLSKSAEDGDTSSYILECQGCGLINDNVVKQ